MTRGAGVEGVVGDGAVGDWSDGAEGDTMLGVGDEPELHAPTRMSAATTALMPPLCQPALGLRMSFWKSEFNRGNQSGLRQLPWPPRGSARTELDNAPLRTC